MNYRNAVLRCPGCGGQLEEQIRRALRIEACSACGGMFIDWLDGEVREVVNRVATPPAASEQHDGDAGDGACPRCGIALHSESIGDPTADILRCGSCAGAFVSLSAFRLLRSAEDENDGSADDPILTRVLDALERIVTFRRS
ncbi:MAG: zf-TFIIB domain-containing protein [Polyangiaceae bacterium]|nr:zf-TFIIB domain-containing protein [Polyangiaceae bacterium]